MTEKSITTFLMARRVSFCLSWAVKSLVHCDGTLGLATEKKESLGHVLQTGLLYCWNQNT